MIFFMQGHGVFATRRDGGFKAAFCKSLFDHALYQLLVFDDQHYRLVLHYRLPTALNDATQ